MSGTVVRRGKHLCCRPLNVAGPKEVWRCECGRYWIAWMNSRSTFLWRRVSWLGRIVRRLP